MELFWRVLADRAGGDVYPGAVEEVVHITTSRSMARKLAASPATEAGTRFALKPAKRLKVFTSCAQRAKSR